VDPNAIGEFLGSLLAWGLPVGFAIVGIFLVRRDRHKNPSPDNSRPCPKCGGDRNWTWYTSQGAAPCPYCHGRGTVNW
jgi:hypothetical protein